MGPETFAADRALAEWGKQQVQAMAAHGVDIGAAGTAERPLTALLGAICQQSARLSGADRASVFVLEDGRPVPAMSCFADGRTDEVLWQSFLSADEPMALVEAVIDDGRPHLAPAAGSPLIAPWWAATFQIGSALAMALGRPEHLVGVLVLDAPAGTNFAVDQASAIAAASGPVIEWARFVEKFAATRAAAAATRRFLQEGAGAATVEEAATVVVRVISEALGTERNAVLYFPEPQVVRVATVDMPADLDAALHRAIDGMDPATSPTMVNAMTERTPQFCDERTSRRRGGLIDTLGVRSWTGIPLLAASGLVGHVVCGDASRVRRWSEGDRRLVTDLAAQGALIIDAARLREADRDHRIVLAHEASHDPLTGLANRRMLMEHLTQAAALGRRDVGHFAVLLVDLDRFKEVNDSLGHHRGDELLVEVARRFGAAMRQSDLVARLGGDEFAILLPATELDGAIQVARNITAALRAPVTMAESFVTVEASIGIAMFPEHADTADLLLQYADAAMYQAKRAHLSSSVYRTRAAAPKPHLRRAPRPG